MALLLVLGSLLAAALVHSPNHLRPVLHDEVQAQTQLHPSRVVYAAGHPHEGRGRRLGQEGAARTARGRRLRSADKAAAGRRLSGTNWQPIRFHTHFIDIAAGDPARELLPKAVAFWERALRVVPAQGPLAFDRACPSGQVLRISSDPSNEWNGACIGDADPINTCGYDKVVIPEHFLRSQRLCPKDAIDKDDLSGCKHVGRDAGVAGADYVILVTMIDSWVCGGGMNGDGGGGDTAGVLESDGGGSGSATSAATWAYASWCKMDQFDRPIMGSINICPSSVSVADKFDLDLERLTTLKHEIGHALGFNNPSFALFRHPDGRPRTPRSSNGDPVHANIVHCSGAAMTMVNPVNTMRAFDERGMHCRCPIGDDADLTSERCTDMQGACVIKIVTPAVRRATRAFFGCDRLQGAELENQMTSLCTPFGSHWESRTMKNELMTASSYAGAVKYVSPITLAAFEDSGWYQANYAAADVPMPITTWGYKRGCAFALDKCLDAAQGQGTGASLVPTGEDRDDPRNSHWCLDSSFPPPLTCTLDRFAQAMCNLRDWGMPLPPAFRYFPRGNSLGGVVPQTDYCPYRAPVANRLCTHAAQQPKDALNYNGEAYGAHSRCFLSTLNQVIDGFMASDPRAGCYEVLCRRRGGEMQIDVTVLDAKGQRRVVHCTEADGVKAVPKTVPGFQGRLVCDRPSILCASAPPRSRSSSSTSVPAGSISSDPNPPVLETAAQEAAQGGALFEEEKQAEQDDQIEAEVG